MNNEMTSMRNNNCGEHKLGDMSDNITVTLKQNSKPARDSSYLLWFIFVCFVLFWDFNGNQHDLYDAIYNFFTGR